MYVGRDADVALRRSQIRSQVGGGVFVEAGGRATVERCTLRDNALGNYKIDPSAVVVRTGNFDAEPQRATPGSRVDPR